MRKEIFATGEYYHIYNRGVDKRTVFEDEYDFLRFLKSMEEFNTIDPIGSLYEKSFKKDTYPQLGNRVSKSENLVEIIAYCLNPNHYHFLVKQVSDKGIEKFMHKVGLGYTKYFNHKNDRSGVLFQGKFKAVHVDTNEYLLHLSVYVNLNDQVHKLGNRVSKSSWEEYTGKIVGDGVGICNTEVVMEQFKNIKEYQDFARNTLARIQERKLLQNEVF